MIRCSGGDRSAIVCPACFRQEQKNLFESLSFEIETVLTRAKAAGVPFPHKTAFHFLREFHSRCESVAADLES